MTDESELETFAKDVKSLMAAMLPGFAEIGADIATQVGDVGQKLTTPENMELADRALAAAPAFGRFADTVLKLAEDGTFDKIRVLMEGAADAVADVDTNDPRKFSILEAAKDLNDKEVQKTLGMFMSFARALPSAVDKHRAEA